MPTIDVKRTHKKSLKEARAAVDRVATAINQRFDIDYEWQGNTLNFSRTGVDGSIALAKDSVLVHVELSFFLFAIAAAVEEQIEKHMDIEFG